MTTLPPHPPDEHHDAEHPDAERWEALARYLSGESPPEEVEALERWLAEDPGRRGLLEALDAQMLRVAAAPPADVNVEAALASVRARLNEPEVLAFPALAQEHARSRPSTILLRVAAVLALALGTGLLWQTMRPGAPDPASLTYTTGVGQTDSVTLSDGTRVQLGPGSRLTVAEGFGDEAREVELVGEARFEVVHDAERVFAVTAGNARVEDLGTAFTVRAAGDGEVKVVVTEGSVLLTARLTTGVSSASVVLRAGDRGRIADGSETPVAETGAATEADMAWTQGRLVYEDATLASVAADLRRWYGVELKFEDPAQAERRISTEGESASEVLRVIGIALGVETEMRGDTAILKAPAAGGAAAPR
jgi:transmembrane sensor